MWSFFVVCDLNNGNYVILSKVLGIIKIEKIRSIKTYKMLNKQGKYGTHGRFRGEKLLS